MNSPTPATGTPQRKRRRSPPRHTTVVRTEQLTPRFRRVVLGGDGLAGFGPARPGAHIKIFLADLPPGWKPDPEQPRPPSRTYTPRYYDADRNELAVDFILHGDGPASNWAEAAQPGDALTIAGPGGGMEIDPNMTEIVLLADETALPAAGTILDALPAGCVARVMCEITNAAEERQLGMHENTKISWLHTQGSNEPPGALLERALRSLAVADDAYWWVACESAAMRRIRQYLLAERGILQQQLVTRGYWKCGEINHPDHDYGE